MQPFTRHSGLVVPLDRVSVDTDQIIPKQFLKRIERTGFGEFLFYDWRFSGDGAKKADFVLHDPRYANATVLIAGKNFGCGSSREHAVWALVDYGFRVVIAPSFADIFAGNCMQNGIATVALPADTVTELLRKAAEIDEYRATVDLEKAEVSDNAGLVAAFEMEEFRRKCLLAGLDEIGLTLQHEAEIDAFEAQHRGYPGVAAS